MLKLFTPLNLVLTSLALSWLSPMAIAQGRADFAQPIAIQAQNESFDIANKMAIFVNNVRITQGTLEILAERMEVSRDSATETDVFVATGSPATYSQQLDDGSPITARANIIRYDQAAQLLTLSGDVEVNQNNSVIRGNEIIYNFATQQLTANRDGSEDDRVTTIFMPKKKNQDDPTER